VPATFAADDERGVQAAVAALRAGEAVVVPTDTVYGLAVALLVPGATKLLFALKDRPEGVPVAVLVGSPAQALELVEPPSAAVARLVDTLWPGPLTVVLRRRADVQLDIGGDGATVGVRCPDHALLRRLTAEVGPLATTSANRHGDPTPETASGAAAALTADVAVVIDGGACRGVASTVVDGTDAALPVLRSGPITPEQVLAAALP
jgi:tRNA threonylcarbamoyl adenosine modification protein (Sua5/YciO/YrdC/YwlC family)